MAMAPPRTCPHPKCGRPNCQKHVATAWRPRGVAPPRIRGRTLQQRRARLFSKNPWCVECLKKKGIKTRATIRDHTIPLAEGGRDDVTNEQGLCRACSDVKTNDESKRGVARGWMR